jgi:beta-phosphoglucomutase-like phosphatase (HAD superfamily)
MPFMVPNMLMPNIIMTLCPMKTLFYDCSTSNKVCYDDAEEAIGAGCKVAVCSTSNEKAVQTIVDVLLGSDVAKIMHVYAGDMVPKKKPDPAVYELAATALGVNPAR